MFNSNVFKFLSLSLLMCPLFSSTMEQQIQQRDKSSNTLMSQEDINHVLQLNKPSGSWQEWIVQQCWFASYFIPLPDASADVKQFVHGELKKIGLKNYEDIQVKLYNDPHSPAAAYPGTIVLKPGTAYTIECFLKKAQQLDSLITADKKDVTKTINWFRGIIQHEGGHLKHQHTLKRSMMWLAVNGPLLYLLLSYVKQYQRLTVTAAALIQILQIYFFWPWYSRIQEQQADDTVVDEEVVLKQMMKMFDHPLDKKDQYSDIFDNHPANWKRAERFQARIDALKQQQKR